MPRRCRRPPAKASVRTPRNPCVPTRPTSRRRHARVKSTNVRQFDGKGGHLVASRSHWHGSSDIPAAARCVIPLRGRSAWASFRLAGGAAYRAALHCRVVVGRAEPGGGRHDAASVLHVPPSFGGRRCRVAPGVHGHPASAGTGRGAANRLRGHERVGGFSNPTAVQFVPDGGSSWPEDGLIGRLESDRHRAGPFADLAPTCTTSGTGACSVWRSTPTSRPGPTSTSSTPTTRCRWHGRPPGTTAARRRQVRPPTAASSPAAVAAHRGGRPMTGLRAGARRRLVPAVPVPLDRHAPVRRRRHALRSAGDGASFDTRLRPGADYAGTR